MPEQKKRKWSKKKIVLVSIGAFFVIAALAGSLPEGYNGNKTTPNEAAQPVRQRDPAQLNVAVSHDDLNVIIANKEPKDLGNCKLKLNNDYIYDAANRYLVNAGQEARIGFSNFTKPDGTRFNAYLIKPKYLRIDCDRKDGDPGSTDIFWG